MKVKIVVTYTENDQPMTQTFNSINDCAKFFNVSPPTIRRCITNVPPKIIRLFPDFKINYQIISDDNNRERWKCPLCKRDYYLSYKEQHCQSMKHNLLEHKLNSSKVTLQLKNYKTQ